MWLTLACQATDLESYSHALTQSDASRRFWTAPPTERIFKDASVPAATAPDVKVYAARNEFEPFQVVINPATSGNVTVSMSSFGAGITTELFQVKYVAISQTSDQLGRLGDYPDPLWPLDNGASVAVTADENTAIWVNVEVSSNAAPGDYRAQLTIDGVAIPVSLHVFNFAIPDDLHLKSQMNFNHNTVLSYYSVPGFSTEYWQYVDLMKQWFIDHRLTPKSVLWPGGVTGSGGGPFIDYDCAGTLTDPHGIWGFESPAENYLDGAGFNDGTGFPSFMAATFQNNDASQDQRPNSFCGNTRQAADWLGNTSSSYNQAWFQYMTALQGYLDGLGYLDAAYYYLANEPQDQADYDAVAWYSQELKRAAPDLKLMVSEEPKPEIYAHSTYTGSKIDIWLPVLQNLNPTISSDRLASHDEETWIYFLHSTRPPYFNPITLDHPGIESKFIGWFAWKYRIRGLAYYAMNNWGKNPWTDPATSGHNGDTFMLYPPSENNTAIPYGSNGHRLVPSIRTDLMRDSLEDYEYLYLLNGAAQPEVGRSSGSDVQADKVITGLTSYARDSEFLYNLRRLIGLHLGGEIATIPDIWPASSHPRAQGPPGNYYVNFQDPAGRPTNDPLIVGGHEDLKIGWTPYDETDGYGWFGDLAHVIYRYHSSGPNHLQRSILYDDWGRTKVFEFDLPNGNYDVTVSVGWPDQTYSHHFIAIEGRDFINDEATTPSVPYLVRTAGVRVADGKLTMHMGISEEYTMLNYLDIEPAQPPGITLRLDMAGVPTIDLSNLATNGDFRIMGTANLSPPNWQPLHSFTATGPSYSWADPAATALPQRYYRAEPE